MKGKLILINGRSIKTSTVVEIINLDTVEVVLFANNELKIVCRSGNTYKFGNLSPEEAENVAEFVSVLAELDDDKSSIKKVIKINM